MLQAYSLLAPRTTTALQHTTAILYDYSTNFAYLNSYKYPTELQPYSATAL